MPLHLREAILYYRYRSINIKKKINKYFPILRTVSYSRETHRERQRERERESSETNVNCQRFRSLNSQSSPPLEKHEELCNEQSWDIIRYCTIQSKKEIRHFCLNQVSKRF